MLIQRAQSPKQVCEHLELESAEAKEMWSRSLHWWEPAGSTIEEQIHSFRQRICMPPLQKLLEKVHN